VAMSLGGGHQSNSSCLGKHCRSKWNPARTDEIALAIGTAIYFTIF
jgi:hypothetical protein